MGSNRLPRELIANRWWSRILAAGVLTFTLILLPVSAQIQQVSSVMNGFGGRASGGSFMHIGAGAQPGGIKTSYDGGPAGYTGGSVHRAGFLNTFFLFAGLDTDGDGLPDEVDPDNDGDRLWDEREVSGEAFSPATPTNPNLPDSDYNGISDYEEMAAGTDPVDAAAGFRFITVSEDGVSGTVAWRARGNHERTYVLKVRGGSYGGIPDMVIWSNTVAGGAAPWYVVTNSVSALLTTGSYYAVEVMHP